MTNSTVGGKWNGKETRGRVAQWKRRWCYYTHREKQRLNSMFKKKKVFMYSGVNSQVLIGEFLRNQF